MFWKALAAILLLILFMPFPVKVRFFYSEGVFALYLYRFKINILKFASKQKHKKNKPQKKKKEEINLKAIPIILHKFNINPFKPTLRVNLFLDYGIDDASATAISYGLLNIAAPFINQIISVMFKVKKYKTKIVPEFNKLTLKIDLESIIFISLAKIIYMSVIAFKSFKLLKKTTVSNLSCNNT